MRKLSCCLLILALFGLSACSKSERGGGPDRASSFTIDGPLMSTSIKQGESDTVRLKIDRGKDFKETVKLKTEAPTGIQATVSESAVKANEKGDVNLRLAVAKDVKPGEHVIRVTGTPETGKGTTLDVKVKVTENAADSKLNLKAPGGVTTIKQGETQTIKISLEPSDKYLADVPLTVKAPKGLTTELTPSTLRAADKGQTTLHVTADKKAPLGEHTIQVSATAEAANVSPAEVKIKVIAP
jgi:uncharacterized membrane protein